MSAPDGDAGSDPIARARSLSNVEDAVALYREWAATYDADVFETRGFTGSARIAELLAGMMAERDQPVIDLGCGTGAVGRRLAQLGVTTIDGLDISPEMLAVARATGAYRRLAVADLDAAPVGAPASYAASVSAGTFTTGHVGAGAVPALLDLVVPGGLVAWVVAVSLWSSFGAALAERRVEVLHDAIEPIRRGGPAEAVMLVARLPQRS